MSRTTIDLDPSVLARLRDRGRREGKSMGRLASELLTAVLASAPIEPAPAFAWIARPMGSRVDLEDAEAVRRATEPAVTEPERASEPG